MRLHVFFPFGGLANQQILIEQKDQQSFTTTREETSKVSSKKMKVASEAMAKVPASIRGVECLWVHLMLFQLKILPVPETKTELFY